MPECPPLEVQYEPSKSLVGIVADEIAVNVKVVAFVTVIATGVVGKYGSPINPLLPLVVIVVAKYTIAPVTKLCEVVVTIVTVVPLCAIVSTTIPLLEGVVIVPVTVLAVTDACENSTVNVVAEGVVATANEPSKSLSLMSTVMYCPTLKPCAEAVVSVAVVVPLCAAVMTLKDVPPPYDTVGVICG
jgi:hypothetical protein